MGGSINYNVLDVEIIDLIPVFKEKYPGHHIDDPDGRLRKIARSMVLKLYDGLSGCLQDTL